MFDINQSQTKYLLRNGSAVPFFYKKLSFLFKKIDNLIHLITIGRVASGVLHDVINPLTSLLLSLDIKDAPRDEIQKSSKELSEFIRIIQTQLKNTNQKENFSVSQVILDCCLLLKYKSITNNSRIVTAFTEDLFIYGNRIILMRIVLNLINNAIESYEKCPQDKNDIVISVYKHKYFLKIEIRDFGCGMSKKLSAKLFKRIYTNKKSGTGLGLYMSNFYLKKEYSGNMKIESILGKGTLVTISIPLKTSV